MSDIANAASAPFFDQNDNAFWVEFEKYLGNNVNEKTLKCKMTYVKDYAHILTTGDARELLSLTDQKRLLIMKALASLSKYLGCYDRWQQIRQRYQLKWSIGDSTQFFANAFSGEHTYKTMIEWLKNACTTLPKSYTNILCFDALTGLRPDEACHSVALVKSDSENYLKNGSVLEHYKYPQLFIRRTKKAYISVVTDETLDIAKKTGNFSYNSIRLAVQRRGLEMHMGYCRKIFATHLRLNGFEPEIIDLLQGRLPKTVFARHYFKPDFNHDRIRQIVTSLHRELA